MCVLGGGGFSKTCVPQVKQCYRFVSEQQGINKYKQQTNAFKKINGSNKTRMIGWIQ